MLYWYKSKTVNDGLWETADVFYFFDEYIGIVYSDEDNYWNVDFVDSNENYIASVSANMTIGALVDKMFEKKECIVDKLNEYVIKDNLESE